jgi:hypothetical protein
VNGPQAQQTLAAANRHIGGQLELKLVRYDCPGGIAVAAAVEGHPDLWYVLTEYHVNIFEDLGAIAAAPPVVRLPQDTSDGTLPCCETGCANTTTLLQAATAGWLRPPGAADICWYCPNHHGSQ